MPAEPELPMQFAAVIDKLDDLLADGKSMPLSSDVRVAREELYDLIDQLRGSVPEELKNARWITKEREEMLGEARREAARVLEEAREQRARLLGRDEIAKAAEARARAILDDARARERDIRLGAEDHAVDILESLENYLVRFAGAVHRGRERLPSREAAQVA